ncbi:hypothetical protein K438DRAFT_2124344 [Mycena galopus ATCC 62051]|nr:hypothetical protein K438DRAFT_2124344 [Mycena galopus ATCC 62051]
MSTSRENPPPLSRKKDQNEIDDDSPLTHPKALTNKLWLVYNVHPHPTYELQPLVPVLPSGHHFFFLGWTYSLRRIVGVSVGGKGDDWKGWGKDAELTYGLLEVPRLRNYRRFGFPWRSPARRSCAGLSRRETPPPDLVVSALLDIDLELALEGGLDRICESWRMEGRRRSNRLGGQRAAPRSTTPCPILFLPGPSRILPAPRQVKLYEDRASRLRRHRSENGDKDKGHNVHITEQANSPFPTGLGKPPIFRAGAKVYMYLAARYGGVGIFAARRARYRSGEEKIHRRADVRAACKYDGGDIESTRNVSGGTASVEIGEEAEGRSGRAGERGILKDGGEEEGVPGQGEGGKERRTKWKSVWKPSASSRREPQAAKAGHLRGQWLRVGSHTQALVAKAAYTVEAKWLSVFETPNLAHKRVRWLCQEEEPTYVPPPIIPPQTFTSCPIQSTLNPPQTFQPMARKDREIGGKSRCP